MALHSHMASDRSLALTIAAALVAVATASATAQEPLQSTPPPHPFGQVRIGTLAFTPTVNLTNVGIDTNVFDFSGTEPCPAMPRATSSIPRPFFSSVWTVA